MTQTSQGGIELSPRARAKLVSVAAKALGLMPATQIPAHLRRGASFTPTRRAKLLGGQIVDAVATDDSFREHLASQLRALEPQLVALVESDDDIGDADVVDAAAVAFVIRPSGWEQSVAAASAVEAANHVSPDGLIATVDRLTATVERAKSDAKDQRDRHRTLVDQLKADNAQLRRTLGQTRSQLKNAEAAAAAAEAAAHESERAAAAAARGLEAELRRLKARIGELEVGHTSARRAVRDDRDAEVMRLRLLLDTVMDAASGLRRELALPPSELTPADTVEAIEPGRDSAAMGAGRSMPDDDPSLLRRLLELPRLHLIVDGYNVSKTAWPELPLDRQRSKLVSGLSGIVGGKLIETTVVFDGADLDHPPAVTSPRSVRVRFSPPGVIADDLIRQLVEAEPVGRPIVVVSTDREVARTVTKKGARAIASMALVRALGR